LSAFTVRSGSALPSLHQNSQPMSQGTYSASNFIRSRTIRAASMTSLPTPSPGIHAILYLAIGQELYRRASRRKDENQRIHHRDHGIRRDWQPLFSLRLCNEKWRLGWGATSLICGHDPMKGLMTLVEP